MVAFELSESGASPGCREVAVAGELDFAVSAALGAVLDRAVGRREHVLLDLSACDFLDVSALAILVRADERLRQRDCQLLLFGVHGQVRRLFAATGLSANESFAPARSQRPERPAAAAVVLAGP